MKKLTCILLFTVIFLIGGIPSYAANFDVTAGIGKLSGDTTYQIGGMVDDSAVGSYKLHFPISELKFPLDVYMLYLGGSIEFADRWKASLNIQTNITDDPGNMKDSDWGVPFEYPPGSGWWWWHGPKSLDIFSTSDTELEAMIWDINLGYTIYKAPKFSLIVGGGYLHQNFDFKCRLIRQYSPSGLSGYDYVGDGSVGLIYEITYDIPYLEVGIQSNVNNKFSVEASLGYSPIVNAEDEDRHLARVPPRIAKGDFDGDAILFSLDGRYDFSKNWFLTFGLDRITIETDGRSKTYIQGRWSHTIDQKTKSTQTSAMFTVGYAFK